MKNLFPSSIFVAAVVLLLAIGGRAADNNAIQNSNSIQGMVVPDNIYERQPFSFAVPQSTGDVVNIQTVEGVVVDRPATDRYGRVFLAAGLPAGAYLISRSSHDQPLGRLEIKQRADDFLLHQSQPMHLENSPQALKLNDPFSLTGHGFSPNCADMNVSLSGSGKTEAPMVLAATEDQLKLAPVRQLPPGPVQAKVTNQRTGEAADAYDLLYGIQGTLEQRTLRSGAQTQLVIRTQPANMPLLVKASVASGPADFGKDGKQAEAVTNNGQTVFAVYAEKHAGPFQLEFDVQPPIHPFGNGITLGTALFRAAIWKLTWLTQQIDFFQNSDLYTPEYKQAKIAELNQEISNVLGPDLEKARDTVKKNLERQIRTLTNLINTAPITSEYPHNYRDWNAEREQLQAMLNDLNQEANSK